MLAAAAAGGALAGAALGALDRPLVGGLINQIARQSDGAALTLGPLGRFLGEATFGPVTRLLLAAFEGAAFGLAVGLSLTRRPSPPPILIQRSRAAHRRLTTRLPAARHPRPAASAHAAPGRHQGGHRDRPPTLRHRRDLPRHQCRLGHPRHLARRPLRRVRLAARAGGARLVGHPAAAAGGDRLDSTGPAWRPRSSSARTPPARSPGARPARTSCGPWPLSPDVDPRDGGHPARASAEGSALVRHL